MLLFRKCELSVDRIVILVYRWLSTFWRVSLRSISFFTGSLVITAFSETIFGSPIFWAHFSTGDVDVVSRLPAVSAFLGESLLFLVACESILFPFLSLPRALRYTLVVVEVQYCFCLVSHSKSMVFLDASCRRFVSVWLRLLSVLEKDWFLWFCLISTWTTNYEYEPGVKCSVLWLFASLSFAIWFSSWSFKSGEHIYSQTLVVMLAFASSTLSSFCSDLTTH